MGLELSVVKKEETAAHCVYVFGPPAAPVGRVRLDKSSGDIELLSLPDGNDSDVPAGSRFYLAHLVPRLQAYHDRGAYPARDQWTV
jgi:hypothetical protein